jgi:C_GCAxxG_C_C family probable redox protein
MKEFDVEQRIHQALKNFEDGYNCCQAVFMAYADLFDLDKELAKNISSGFGGGMGRMREVCGTTSAMTIFAGLLYPVTDTTDNALRTRNYDAVQRMAEEFKTVHGSIICRELLASLKNISKSPTPERRTAEYYKIRPCGRFVETAARIVGEEIKRATV